jgi:hypothetical protein
LWQISIGRALNVIGDRIIQASNSLESPSSWGAAALIREQNATAMSFVKLFSHHNYPGGKTVAELMSHVNVVRNIAQYRSDIGAALRTGREYVFGETNSGVYFC